MVTLRGGHRVGTMFGPYELRSLIGVGGMGEVYRAYDTAKGRMVALKLLRPEVAADPGFQQRFRRESQMVARLQEPHVIPVHDWGDVDGVLYIDMRLVEGANLKTVLEESGPLDPARAAAIITQVAAALDAAHADGLVHRDIKPENILLTPNDFAYLVDFGIARQDGHSGLTTAGVAIGSAVYMAPERFEGATVGPQADVYSLTCVLYECLTSHPPFPAKEVIRLMKSHLSAVPPRPSAARVGVGPAFDHLIARGMAKRPEDRFATAGELAAAARAAAMTPTAVPPQRPQEPPTVQIPAARPILPSPPAPRSYLHDPRPHTADAPKPAVAEDGRRGAGAAQYVMAGGALGLLIMALVATLWLAFGPGEPATPPATTIARQTATPTVESPTSSTTESTEPTTTSRAPTSSAPTTTEAPTTTTAPTTTPTTTTSAPTTSTTAPTTTRTPAGSTTPSNGSVQGFAGTAARCNAGDTAATKVRTNKSLVVICQTGDGEYYYRGQRISDGANLQLADPVRSGDGWDVTNPADGTRYVIRPDELIITNGVAKEVEPVVQYSAE